MKSAKRAEGGQRGTRNAKREAALHPALRTPRSALVTGAARGIGAAIARHLASKGIAVAIHYRNSAKDARAVLAACKKNAPRSVLVQGDLTDAKAAARVCKQAAKALGGVDLLVNNVGNYLRKDILEMSVEEWRDQIESNLYTAFYTSRALLPAMRKRRYGRVVNIGYAGAQQAFYNRKTVPYHIAKTGLHILTRNLAAAVARDGVTVNCLGMGVMENSIRKPADIPAGRVGKYADVLNALDFLLRPESAYINGAQIDISGGWLPEQIL